MHVPSSCAHSTDEPEMRGLLSPQQHQHPSAGAVAAARSRFSSLLASRVEDDERGGWSVCSALVVVTLFVLLLVLLLSSSVAPAAGVDEQDLTASAASAPASAAAVPTAARCPPLRIPAVVQPLVCPDKPVCPVCPTCPVSPVCPVCPPPVAATTSSSSPSPLASVDGASPIRFVFNASGVRSMPADGELLARRVLEVCYETDVSPPPYWVGLVTRADTDDGPLVNVHRPVPHASLPLHCGAFVLPRGGVYRLELHQPQLTFSLDDDSEPHVCISLLPASNTTQLHAARTSAVLNRTLAMCGWTAEQAREGTKRPTAPILHAPATTSMDRRVIAHHRFTVASTDDDTAAAAAAAAGSEAASNGSEVVQQLYELVYRNASQLLAHNTVGYWQRRGSSAAPSGSPPATPPGLPAIGDETYQPEPVGCPETFKPDVGHQSRCNFSVQALQWHPTFGSRQGWLASPPAIREYANRTVTVVVGDSLGFGVWRGLHCAMGGYGQTGNALLLSRLLFVHNAVELLAMFPAISLQMQPTYAEFLSILRPPAAGFNPGGDTVVVWNFGLWMASFVASSDWARGLSALMTFIRQHAAEMLAATGERQRHYFNTVTGVHSIDMQPGWQTATRVHQWNTLLLHTAVKHGMPLIDLHNPSAVRPDGRTDNCHYCDTVMYELAHIVLNALIVGPQQQKQQPHKP